MSTRTEIENAVRAWLVAAGVAGGIATPAAKVIIADQDTVRPALPYLTVRCLVSDIPVHEDEDIESLDDDDDPIWLPRGQRTATVSVDSYEVASGTTGESWMERAVAMLRAPAVQALLTTAGITVRPLGGSNNLSGLLDDVTEARFHRDFAVDYQRGAAADEQESVVPLEEIVRDEHYTDGGTAPELAITVTLDLP